MPIASRWSFSSPGQERRRRRIRLLASLCLVVICGLGFLLWLKYLHHTGADASRKSITASSAGRMPALPGPRATESSELQAAGALPSRPRSEVLDRNLHRAGFQWIFKQLGARDSELNWITAGQFSELIRELRPGVERGEARATAVFGWIAERCRLLRSAEQQVSWREFNSARLQQLGAQDQAEYRDVVARQDQWEQSFRSACESQIDQDYVDHQLVKAAATDDGATLWLLSRRSDNHIEDLRLMAQAASRGFAQARYEFARSLIMDPDARSVVPDSPSVGSLLAGAASEVPEAKAVLARCFFEGCDGAQPDYGAALETAREAAAQGYPDTMLFLGKQLPPGALSPDEVGAWRLFKATLAAQGCYGDEDTAFGLEPIAYAPSPPPSEAARRLAVSFWQRYSGATRARLGCGD
jgi:TPR repeat protein